MFRDAVERGRRWIRQPTDELKGAQWSLRYMIDLVRHCARELARDRAEEMAAALSYRTIFALVPLFVLALVMFRVVGVLTTCRRPFRAISMTFLGCPRCRRRTPIGICCRESGCRWKFPTRRS